MSAKHRQTFLPGFDRGFVDAVELEELAVSLSSFFFHTGGSHPLDRKTQKLS
jgi:hypothetical protein